MSVEKSKNKIKTWFTEPQAKEVIADIITNIQINNIQVGNIDDQLLLMYMLNNLTPALFK